MKLQEVVNLNQFQLHNRKPSSGVMKIGPKGRDYIAKRCDTLKNDQLMNCDSYYSCGKYRILPSEEMQYSFKSDQSLAWNSIKQLEDNFLLYGKYNLDSLEKIIHTINHLGDRVHQVEKLLLGKDHTVTTQQFLHSSYIGRLLFPHKLNIYLTSIQETQLRLYDELERVLREFLSAVRILSKGYLPASLFPPTVLHRITSNALQMVQKKNPDYVLTIKHITEYYDMKMVTFGE